MWLTNAVEVHDTRYQFGFAMTPAALGREGIPPHAEDHLSADQKRQRVRWAMEGLQNLRRVGGNHARYFCDYSPQAVVLRWTDDPAPRFLYCFEQDEHGALSLQGLLARVGEKSADIEGAELVIGTPLAIAELEALAEKGAHVTAGVKAAVEEMLSKISDEDLT